MSEIDKAIETLKEKGTNFVDREQQILLREQLKGGMNEHTLNAFKNFENNRTVRYMVKWIVMFLVAYLGLQGSIIKVLNFVGG